MSAHLNIDRRCLANAIQEAGQLPMSRSPAATAAEGEVRSDSAGAVSSEEGPAKTSREEMPTGIGGGGMEHRSMFPLLDG